VKTLRERVIRYTFAVCRSEELVPRAPINWK